MLMLAFPIFLFAFQFVYVKEYQNRAGYGITQGFFMNMVIGGFAFIVLFTIKGFSLHFTPINILFAFLVGLGVVVLKIMLIKAVGMGKIAISTFFYVLGAVLLPFIYGVGFLSETLTIYKIIGILFICLSLLPIIFGGLEKSNNKKVSFKFIIICFIIFFSSGMTGVLAKANQSVSSKEYTVDFIALYSFAMFIISIIGLLTSKHRISKQEFYEMFQFKKAFSAVKVSICNTSANIFSLYLATTLPASIQFPVMQCGIMIVTTILSLLIYKEFPNKKTGLSIITAIIAIIFLAK